MFKYFIALFLIGFSAFAQDLKEDLPKLDLKGEAEYEDDFLSASFHKSRRDSLRKLLPEGGVAIFFSSPIRNRSNDVDYEYHQDPNFYYLTGLKEPNAAIILFKESYFHNGILTNEILFMQEKDSVIELWNGKRMGVEMGRKELGIKTVEANAELPHFSEMDSSRKIYYIKPTALQIGDSSNTKQLFGLYTQLIRALPESKNYAEKHLQLMMAKLRQVKTDEEMKLLRKAIDITCAAQIELMRSLQPGMHEYETEAIVEYIFKRNGAEHPGFPSIQGGGENSCVLHYISNRKQLRPKDLLVSDIGAEYHSYTADVTRTIPADGHFSKEERAIYELVLKAQTAGIAEARVGNNFFEPHRIAKKIIAEGLMELGIIDKVEHVGRYFMHGSSHYLGLDVHDAGLYGKLEEGNVITVEPGIYITENADCDKKWWNIGVRIEDDILITASGPENLSDKAPKTVAEIEKLMLEQGYFEEEKILQESN